MGEPCKRSPTMESRVKAGATDAGRSVNSETLAIPVLDIHIYTDLMPIVHRGK